MHGVIESYDPNPFRIGEGMHLPRRDDVFGVVSSDVRLCNTGVEVRYCMVFARGSRDFCFGRSCMQFGSICQG